MTPHEVKVSREHLDSLRITSKRNQTDHSGAQIGCRKEPDPGVEELVEMALGEHHGKPVLEELGRRLGPSVQADL